MPHTLSVDAPADKQRTPDWFDASMPDASAGGVTATPPLPARLANGHPRRNLAIPVVAIADPQRSIDVSGHKVEGDTLSRYGAHAERYGNALTLIPGNVTVEHVRFARATPPGERDEGELAPRTSGQRISVAIRF